MIFQYTWSLGILAPLALIFLLSPLGISVLALGSELTGQCGNKLADKFAQQMARMGIVIASAITLAFLILFLWQMTTSIYLISPIFILFRLGPPLLLGVVLLTVYWGSWKKMKSNKPTHATLGAMSAVLFAIFSFFLLTSALTRKPILDLQHLPSAGSLIYPLVLQWLFFSVLASGILGSAYLLIRRNRDDFGRDYYRYALKLSCKWTLAGIILGFATCIWIAVLLWPHFHITPLIIPGTLTLISAAIIIALSITLLKSVQPLRFKGIIVLAQLALWILFMGRLLAHLEFMNMLPNHPRTITFASQLIQGMLN